MHEIIAHATIIMYIMSCRCAEHNKLHWRDHKSVHRAKWHECSSRSRTGISATIIELFSLCLILHELDWKISNRSESNSSRYIYKVFSKRKQNTNTPSLRPTRGQPVREQTHAQRSLPALKTLNGHHANVFPYDAEHELMSCLVSRFSHDAQTVIIANCMKG